MRNKIDLRKLPPLNALKGFEATTRRESVREAAEELCLTHPAVSYQIQVLEQDLGVPLFSRTGRSLVPTAEGRLLYKHVRTALEMLIEGAETVRRTRAGTPLRVQTYVTASIRWLARKLPDFVARHPDVRLQLSTCAFEWDFDESSADVGLANPATASSSRTLPASERRRLSTSHVVISSRRSAFSISSPKIETRKIPSGKSEKRTR